MYGTYECLQSSLISDVVKLWKKIERGMNGSMHTGNVDYVKHPRGQNCVYNVLVTWSIIVSNY